MQSIQLREPFPTVPIDPLSVAPDPREMGQMYIGAREKYPDGMTLACATPREPYDNLIKKYAEQRNLPGFSDVEFFEENFIVSPPEMESLVAKPGQTLDEYTLDIRPKFVFSSSEEKNNFDTWLPYPFWVAGIGRFMQHNFNWDGCHIGRGHVVDGEWEQVLNGIDNNEYMINTFGYPPNGSADFYLTRAQPDYFSHMVRTLADHMGPEALVRYLPAMEKNHMEYWMDGMNELSELPLDGEVRTHRTLVRMPDGSFLNRYWDDADGPRLESYKEDVEIGELAVAGLAGAIREAKLRKVYKDLRAGAASGHDYSSRWFEDGLNLHTINTTDIAPIDLNSLMAYNEETLAMAYEAAADAGGHGEHDAQACRDRAEGYREMAANRIAAINTYMWDEKDGIFRDYNFAGRYQTNIVSSAMVYPLYVGVTNAEQSFGVAEAVRRDLLYEGGVIATTTMDSNEQWDGKNVWAPPNWAAVRGFARMAHILMKTEANIDVEPLLVLAEDIRSNYMRGIQKVFDAHGIVPEKHRGDDPATLAGGGEYALVTALGMSSETYRAMQKLNPRDAGDHLPMGKLALTAA